MTLTTGTTHSEVVIDEVHRHMFVRYAGASGDFNPIHYDETFAKSAGYDTVFAQGMFTAGVLATFLTSWVGAANVRRFRVRFTGQVWPGEQLTATAEVTEAGDDGAEVDLTVTNADGDVKIRGDASVLTSP